ncbi:MAG TPA: hypothetical protein VFX84_01725 [Candidatus Saccharimonadales bacterium]|nr:hypothetical protein [Candidatus Saccharimonadales bacterium]
MCKEVPRGTHTVITVESDLPREDVLLPAAQPSADVSQVVFLR